jgi:hypothetical protein
MAVSNESNGKVSGLIARIKGILLTPNTEWATIDKEQSTVASLYLNYIAILAAIGPVAIFLRGELFGYGAFGVYLRPSLISALSMAVVSYVLALVMVFVLALIVDALAPTFQGQKSRIQALKLTAYAATAGWLAGIFSLIPALTILGLLGLYSLYLFYVGLPVMMKSPAEKSLVYTAVVIVIAVVLSLLISPLSALLVDNALPTRSSVASYLPGTSQSGGTVTLPNGSTVDVGKMQQAAKAMSQSVNRAQSGPAVTADTLKSFLPASLPGGLGRSEISSMGGQMGGVGGTIAEAKYSGGGAQVTLTITDLGAAGAMAAMGGAFGVSSDKQTATSYSKVWQENGRMLSEEYDSPSRHGSYGVILASRFLVHAEGSPVSMDDLHAAVASVDLDKLQDLVK